MTNSPDSPGRSTDLAPDVRLDSWKEIALYLKRDATTVRRWEKREGLPVHRHQHERRDSVYAYKREIDAWWESRRSRLAGNAKSTNGADGLEAERDTSATPELAARRRPNVLWIAAVMLGVATLGLVWSSARHDTPRAGAMRLEFSILPPEKMSFGSLSLSPDEHSLAFTASGADGNGGLWIRPLDSMTARLLPDTEGASFPFWSPGSDAIGFFAGGKLWVTDVAGGRPREICDAPEGRGGTWNRDGVLVFAPGRLDVLYRVPASGGVPSAITAIEDADHRGHLWPEFLPDGNHFLYLADGDNTPETHQLLVGTLDGSDRRALFPLASNASFVRDGFLVFVRDRQLIAQPFDAERLTLRGEPHTLVDRVQQRGENDHKGDFSASRTGVLVYRAMQSPSSRLIWRDRAQTLSPLIATPAEHYDPELSPDETRIALTRFDPELSKRFGYGVSGVRSDVLMVDRKTGHSSQFTTDPAADWGPVWRPDGGSVVFSSNRTGRLALYQKGTNAGPGEERLLASEGQNPVAQSWSPDGRFLVYSAYDPKSRMDLWLLPMTGAQTPQPLLQTPASEDQAEISPDGRWFAYASSASGREEVYVQSFPEPGPRYRISAGGAGDPRWRADGKELFFIGHDRRLMSVSVRTGDTFAHGSPVPLFDTGLPPHWYEARNLYDVSRDGEFLFLTPVEDDRSSPATVVINWATTLVR